MTISALKPADVRGSPAPATHRTGMGLALWRHPSSHKFPGVPACPRCGFEPPATPDIASAILAIPDEWASLLSHDTTETMLAEAARLRDELHVVANRISRVLAVPGAAVLATVRIDSPTAWTRTIGPDQLIALLKMAAERLAELVRSLRPADWHLTGRAGRKSLSIRDLALLPLHRSHARLTRGRTCK